MDRRSIVASRDLNKGEIIKEKDLEFKRIGIGLESFKLKMVLEKILIVDVEKD